MEFVNCSERKAGLDSWREYWNALGSFWNEVVNLSPVKSIGSHLRDFFNDRTGIKTFLALFKASASKAPESQVTLGLFSTFKTENFTNHEFFTLLGEKISQNQKTINSLGLIPNCKYYVISRVLHIPEFSSNF